MEILSKQSIHKIILITFFLFSIIFIHTAGFAALKLKAVYPTLGVLGQDLEISLTGTGFDENTRLSMSLDVGNRISIIGSVDTPGSANAITIVGDTAYVTDGDSGLQVIDISKPQNPQIIGSMDTPGDAMSVTVVGDTAYVADGSSGLQVIDISDPQSPQIIGSVDTPGSANDITVVGDTAYVADGSGGGLQVIDISNPQSPQIIGSVDTPGYAHEIAIVGDNAYVADGLGSGLQVIDISNPQSPQIIGSVNTGAYAVGVIIVDEKAYVESWTSGLYVLDISDPQNPKVIGSVDTPGYANGGAVVGEKAYVADYYSGLQVIDISNPQSPQIIGSVDTPGKVVGVTIVGDNAYVADGDNGLQVIDISAPQSPQVIGSVDTPGSATDITIVGDNAYVADGSDGGIQVIDVSDPQSPKVIGSVDTPGSATDITIVGDNAYVADGSDGGIQVIDVSIPQNPQVIGAVDTPGSANAITIVGDTAYVADGSGGLQVIDISDPQNPQIIGSVDTPRYANEIAIVGDNAYVVDGGFRVIDISDPQNPQIVGSVDTPGSAYWGVIIVGDNAYVANLDTGLQVIDISDSQSPQIIGSVDTPGWAYSVAVVGDMAYVADGYSGLYVVDISNPQNPQIIGSVDTPGVAHGVIVVEDNAYVADGSIGGLTIVPLPIEILPITVNNEISITVTLPSPQIPGHYTLRVFNGSESYELIGAVTFSDSETYEVQQHKKAIIVAGGGPYPGNNLWEATQTCTNFAYLSLLSQGYTRDNIYYLSPITDVDVDGDGLYNDVDKDTTNGNLSYAINVWANDANEVLLYMTDHGGNGTFMLNGIISPIASITAETLDGWLDDLQMTMPGKVIFIYDACQSGSFLPQLTPPEGKERIVITSSLAEERAWFINNGILSFSYQFWASIFLNANLYDAYVTSKNMMEGDQTSLIDADGDGIGSEKDDKTLAYDIIIGRGRVAASTPPIIGNVSKEQTLNGQTSASFWASDISALNSITRVWATIIAPDYNQGSLDSPITDIPTVDLVDSDQDGTYDGVYESFTKQGTYRITIYATDKEGVYSLPKQTTVVQLEGEIVANPIQLNSSWNLISPYNQPADTDISSVLSSISGKYVSVWAYIDGSWKVYDPNNPGFSDLTTMVSGRGYWINMTEYAALSVTGSTPSKSIDLQSGWNLVGYNSSTSQPMADALASITGKYVSVWAYVNGSWKVYDPNNPGFSDLTTMDPAYGYWINATEECTWTLP